MARKHKDKGNNPLLMPVFAVSKSICRELHQIPLEFSRGLTAPMYHQPYPSCQVPFRMTGPQE
jgi:hypothetical protein